MKRLWIAGLAAAGLLAGSAMAQDQPPMPQEGPPPGSQEGPPPTPQEGPPPGRTETTTTTTTWTVRPEERTVIHDYVVREKMRPVRVQQDLMVGAPAPEDIQLQPVPEEIYTSVPEARRDEYFDWNGRMVFVDPDTRRIVQIVD